MPLSLKDTTLVDRIEIHLEVPLATSDGLSIIESLRSGPLNRYEAANPGRVAWPSLRYNGRSLVIECKTGARTDNAAMLARSGLRGPIE